MSREYFQKHCEDDRTKLAVLLAEPWFQNVLNLTLAEMASREPLQLRQASFPPIPGANAFIHTLRSMVADDVLIKEPPVAMPSYDEGFQPEIDKWMKEHTK